MSQKRLIIFMPSIEGGGVEKNLFIISDFLSKKINGTSDVSDALAIAITHANQMHNKIAKAIA